MQMSNQVPSLMRKKLQSRKDKSNQTRRDECTLVGRVGKKGWTCWWRWGGVRVQGPTKRPHSNISFCMLFVFVFVLFFFHRIITKLSNKNVGYSYTRNMTKWISSLSYVGAETKLVQTSITHTGLLQEMLASYWLSKTQTSPSGWNSQVPWLVQWWLFWCARYQLYKWY